jgi:KipI family sensor histidine kinase inhibitor
MRTPVSRIVPFGDRALLVETADVASAHGLASALETRRTHDEAPTGVVEVVVGWASVLVILDPRSESADGNTCAHWVAETVRAGPNPSTAHGQVPRSHVLPVVFDGADLADVAACVSQPVGRVVELMASAEFEVAFVGFAPGFPYLTGLPAELVALPRRTTPRMSVPAGSVAMAAGFASVYPRSTPGGWHLLGRTDESLFDPDVPPHSRVAPGDTVRFLPSDPSLPHRPDDAVRPLIRADGRCLEVVQPGLSTTVQDGGRRGWAHAGVPAAGGADLRSLGLANLLLGNRADAAALECTSSGPVFRMWGDGHLAVVGARSAAVDITVDGHPVPDGTVLPVADGQVVRVGRVRHGLRAYVAVAGGLATPEVLGSRSSDALAGLGPGVIQVGDRLARGEPGRARGSLETTRGPVGGPTLLRVVAGPHGSPEDGLVATRWTVGVAVNRIGLRLTAAGRSQLDAGGTRSSVPMVTGAVQVPPDGRPIILLPDHATVGGYPVVACVVTADLPLLGQLVPGETVAFVEVDLDTAARLRVADRVATASQVTGWFPTVAGI